MRATRVSADAIAKAKERRERAERERVEKEKAEAERREKEKGLGEELFGVAKGAFGGGGSGGGNVNPFSTSGGGTAAANPFAKPAGGASVANPFSTASTPAPTAAPAVDESKPSPDAAATNDLPKTFAETLSLNNPQPPSGPPPPPEPWPAETDLPSPYPVSYLAEADYETLDPQPPSVPQATRMDLDNNDNSSGGGSGGGKEDKEVFESTIDSTFQKFADRLAQNPDQCIRYEFGGTPLLYSKTDAVGKKLHDVPASQIGNVLPRCGHCGAKRVCEVQLTPQAIVELEGDDVLEGMDWGAVIVAVCEGDCLPRGTGDGEVAYAEEWVGVQWEELTSRR